MIVALNVSGPTTRAQKERAAIAAITAHPRYYFATLYRKTHGRVRGPAGSAADATAPVRVKV